jgi:hypothetical protein
MWIGTFHSIGARLLRRHAHLLGWSPSFTIYDADASLAAIRRTMGDLNIPEKKWHPRRSGLAISDAKNRLIRPGEFEGVATDAFARVVARVYPAYQAALKEQNAFDFDDLLVKPVELLRGSPDCWTATGPIPVRPGGRVPGHEPCPGRAGRAAGPGAPQPHGGGRRRPVHLRVARRGREQHPGVRPALAGARLIRLEQNYRSTGRILDAANAVIAENVRRKGKTLRTEEEAGERLTLVESGGRAGRGGLDRVGDRAANGRRPGAGAPRLRRPLSHERPVPGAGARIGGAGPAVPDRGRDPVLRAARDHGRAGVPEAHLEPTGCPGVRPGRELPPARRRGRGAAAAAGLGVGAGEPLLDAARQARESHA